MGDLTAKMQEVFKQVETAINKGLGRAEGYNNDKLDLTERAYASVFANEIIQNAVDSGDISAEDATEIFGLVLSPQAQAQMIAARKTQGTGDGDNNENGGVGGDGTGSGESVTIVHTGDGGVHVTINNSSEWSLTINISAGDAANIESILNTLLQAFMDGIQNFTKEILEHIDEKFAEKFQKLVAFLTTQNEENMNNVFQMINQLFTLLADNNKLQIGTLNKILDALNQLGIKIDGATEIIAKLLKAQLKALQDSNFKMGKLVELVHQNNKNQETQIENQEKTNAILTMILDAIGKFADSFGNFSDEIVAKFNTLFEMLENKQISYDQIIALLQAIKDDTSEGNTISKQILDVMSEINAKFSKYGDDIKALLTQIATKEVIVNVEGAELNVSIDIDAILEKLDTLIQNTSENQEIQKKILEAINKFGLSISDSLITIIENMGKDSTKIDALLKFLEQMDENNSKNTQKLLDAIANIELNVSVDNLKVDIDVQGIIDAIMNSSGNINAKMDEITKLLNAINKNIEKGNDQRAEIIDISNQILAEVKSLGFTVSGGLATLIEKADGNIEELKKILAFLNKMDVNAGDRNKAVIDVISKIGLDVIDALNNLEINVNSDGRWQEVIDAINSNTEATLYEGDNANTWLHSIFQLITTLNSKVGSGGGGGNGIGITLEQLQAMLNNLVNNLTASIGTNFDELMAILQQILAAIEDHTVKVEIHYDNETGECTIVNEGENSGQGDIFSARGFSGENEETGIEPPSTTATTPDNPNAVVSTTKKLLDGHYGGLKGLHIIKEYADGTVDVTALGGQKVRNRVPKEKVVN